MNNLNHLITHGIVPQNHTLNASELSTIAALSQEEINALTQSGAGAKKPVHKGGPAFHSFL